MGRINVVPTRVGDYRASPFELFYGRKIDYKRNLRASFGDYVHVAPNAMDNSMKSRSEAAIALYDTGNVEGTWVVYNLRTKTTAKRNTLTTVPIPDIVIAHMNKLAERRAVNRDPQFGVGRGNKCTDGARG